MNTLPLDWENKNISVQILFEWCGEWSAQTVKRLVKRLEALEAKDA